MLDPIFTTNRVETYWIDRLDQDDNPVETLPRTSGGTVTQDLDAPIRGGFQFTLQSDRKPFDYMTTRFQPWVMVSGKKWPLGVFLPSSPTVRSSSARTQITIPCHDKTIILDRDKTIQTYSIPAGTPVVATVVDIIEGFGETSLAVTSSDAVTPIPMTWTIGTSWLKIVNNLLRSVNYSPLWTDGFGQYRIEPYFEPFQKEPRWEFKAGALSIHSPDWQRSRDIANVPNRVVLVATGTDDKEEMISIAENTDPHSSFSYQARGDQWVTRSYENVEAADQTTLDDLAVRYLADATRAVASINLSHAVVPLDPGDVVVFKASRIPDTLLAQVKEYSISLQTGALVDATWTEVGT